LSEPRYIHARTYRYRLHGANTIAESASEPRSDANRVLREYLDWATPTAPSDSEWAPCVSNWGAQFVVHVLSAGMAEVLDPQQLRAIVVDLTGDTVDVGPGRHA